MTSFLLVFNPSTDSLLRPVQLKTNVFRSTKNSGKVDLLKIDINLYRNFKMNGKVEIIDRLTSIVLPDPCPLLKPYAKYVIGNIHYMDLNLII